MDHNGADLYLSFQRPLPEMVSRKARDNSSLTYVPTLLMPAINWIDPSQGR